MQQERRLLLLHKLKCAVKHADLEVFMNTLTPLSEREPDNMIDVPSMLTGIILGDPRQEYLAELLAERGIPSVRIEQPDREVLPSCSVIIAPTPFTRDQKTLYGHPEISVAQFLSWLAPGQLLFGGNLPWQVTESARKNGILSYDFMGIEEVAVKNAAAAAEGAIAEAIKASPVNLEGSPCLLAGYGRCGRVLARKLNGLGARVTVCEKEETTRILAEKESFPSVKPEELSVFLDKHPVLFLFNTIPCPLFGEPLLQKMPAEVTIIDIASAPGGTDFDYCKKSGRTALLCPGLPGRYSPKTSAEILCDAFLSIQRQRSGGSH